MISEKQAKLFCREDITKIRRYTEAVADRSKKWELHHCLGLVYSQKELIEMGLYYSQPAEYLMFVTPSEHKTLHYKFDEKRKRRISESTKGKTAWNKGVPRPQHLRDRQSKLMSGFNNPNFGKPVSELTKQKLRSKNNCKKVYQYTKDKSLVNVYESANMAAKENNINQGNITNCCHGRCKSYKGYIWSYTQLT